MPSKRRIHAVTSRNVTILIVVFLIVHQFLPDGRLCNSDTYPFVKTEVYNGFNRRLRWSFSDAPSFCKDMLMSPLPSNGEICGTRSFYDGKCEDGSVRMFSQFKQDHYIFVNHFSKLDRRGVYIDLASNEPVTMSNSYFFDICLGWDGICVEANPQYHDKIRLLRSCKLIPRCVSDTENRKVSYVLAGGLGGISETIRFREISQERKIQMNCLTMRDVLGLNIRNIDYMSLDVEGHEIQVLNGFDWNTTKVSIITIEISEETLPSIENFLTKKGYVRHWVNETTYPSMAMRQRRKGLLYTDAVFTHSSVTFGRPE